MKKAIIGIFISLGAIFLMSHNASAVSETFYLKYGVYSYGIPVNTGAQGGGTTYVTSNDSYNYNINAYSLRPDMMFYSMAFRFKSDNSNVDLSKYTDYTFTFSYCSDTQYFAPSSNDYFRVTDYYEYQASLSEITLGTGTTYSFNKDHCRNVMLKGKNGIKQSTNAFQLGTTNNNSFTRIFGYNFNDTSSAPRMLILSPTVVFYETPDEADQALEKERTEAQDAADQSESSGNSSQSSSQGATSSLLSVFTGFANVITNASATNCVINAPLNTTFSSDRLNVDLCALSLPPAIGALTSIIAVMVVVPFAVSMFNKFIGIMQGFQK